MHFTVLLSSRRLHVNVVLSVTFECYIFVFFLFYSSYFECFLYIQNFFALFSINPAQCKPYLYYK